MMKMNNKPFALLAVIVVLSVALLSACADSPEADDNADGVWCYMPRGLWPIEIRDYAPPESFFLSSATESVWTGTFTGESKDGRLLVSHGTYWPGEPTLFVSTSSFEDVVVGGVSGGLEMDAIGDRPDATSDWSGTWVVTSGTGDLEGLRAHGTFWGPGWLGNPEECGVIYYSVEEIDGIDFVDGD
jgi:hypothetical protein